MASWIPHRLLDEDSDLERIRDEYAYNPGLPQDSLSQGEPVRKTQWNASTRVETCSPSESEFAYNPWLEQDKEPWERRWEEDHAYDPEREDG